MRDIYQGGSHEVRRSYNSNRVPACSERDSKRAVGQGLQGTGRKLSTSSPIDHWIYEGIGSGDPVLDVMAAGVALNLSDELGGF